MTQFLCETMKGYPIFSVFLCFSPWPCILLTLDLPDIDFRVLFWIFIQTGFSKLSGSVNLQKQGTARFWMSNSPIKALTLWMLATFWIRSPSKIKIPPYFQYKESPCISYSYTRSVATKIFNYKASLQQFDFQGLSQDLPPCNCSDSQFLYAQCGHIVTGDLNIVRNVKLRDLLSKGPKYREPVSYSWHQNLSIIMDACEEYARRWAKKEDVEVDTLSDWIKSIADVLKRRIRRLKHSVNTRHESIFSDPDVVRELSRLHENFVIVPADKASNNYTFVCKRHYVRILSEELGLNSLPGNPTYNLMDFSASEVLDNHKSVLTSFGIETSDDELDLPYIYWIPKMHKNPYKQRFIAGSSKCSTKPLSILLTKLLTHIKQGLQKYCETAYSRSGINQMWILKNSKELLEHLKSPAFNHVTSIKSFDFSTLYTTIPHQKLKERLTSIIRNAFIFKNGNRRYKYLVLGHEETYFVKEHSDSKNKYSEDDIIKMLEFLVDNIFVVFAGKVFQQTVGIPMGTNCAPLLADIFLYSYEADFIQSLLSTGKKHLASRFNLTYRYIDDVLSINNPEFENYLGQYPAELEIKDTTESTTSASYLDLLLSIGRDGQLHTSIYDKRDDFNFHITNFPFLSSNIPSSPAYGVFISQLIRYSRACSSYECFILRARRLSSKLLKQGYLAERLKSSFRKFYGRYGGLIQQYEVSLSRMLIDILILDQQWLPNQSDFPPISWPWYRAWPSPIMSGFHGAFATGVACQQGTLTLPDTWFRPPFWDLLMLQLLRPNSSNLPCLFSTFHLEYPLVLSRFCFRVIAFHVWKKCIIKTDYLSIFKVCILVFFHMRYDVTS